ncbi:MAG: hypothetical protein E7513_05975 [Ruminococcaceae bacterium]|nr:hypothetical protein [Oscillospiraceae bacterium]
MKLVPMRFMGYMWHHNPKTLEIKSGKRVVSLSVPYSFDVFQNFGENPVKVTGTGELYSNDCLEQFERLNEIYQKGECGVLCLPGLSPMYACFDTLTLIARPTPDVLTYSFSFTQVKSRPKFSGFTHLVDASGYNSLWEISRKHSVDIATLVMLNPHIMFINDLSKTERVRVC